LFEKKRKKGERSKSVGKKNLVRATGFPLDPSWGRGPFHEKQKKGNRGKKKAAGTGVKQKGEIPSLKLYDRD